MTNHDLIDRPSPAQIEGWKRMTPAQRLELASRIRTTAIELVEVGIREREPHLTPREVRRRRFEIMLRG